MQAVHLPGKHAIRMPLLHGKSASRPRKGKALPIKAVAEVAEVEAPPMAASGRVKLGSSDLQVSGADLLLIARLLLEHFWAMFMLCSVLSRHNDLGSTEHRKGGTPSAELCQ